MARPRQSSNFISDRRVFKTQYPAILRIGQCRARGARSDAEVNGLSIEEAVSIRVAVARNIDRGVEWIRNLDVDHVTSEIARGHQRSRHDFFLNTEVPRLRIGRLQVRIACEVITKRYPRHVLSELNWKWIPSGVASPWIVKTSRRRQHAKKLSPRWLADLRALAILSRNIFVVQSV